MQFHVVTPRDLPRRATSVAYLVQDNWDDWFTYSTMYALIVFDDQSQSHRVGEVKFGRFGMGSERSPNLPTPFEALDERYFSLGQDDSYYDALNELGDQMRDLVLRSLRDVAADGALFIRSLGEKVTGVSLLRSVARTTVESQFSRLARGGERLTNFSFGYTIPASRRVATTPVILEFDVEPDSTPPTNIHVVIGRNGVGKTHLLNNMTQAIVGSEGAASVGSFDFYDADDSDEDRSQFSGVVSVSFSAFDHFKPLSEPRNRASGIRYSYIGLKRYTNAGEDRVLTPMSHRRLATSFVGSLRICIRGARSVRWRRAMEMLLQDPMFLDANVLSLLEYIDVDDPDDTVLKDEARALFDKLSSGHKIILLTLTRLVETVEERTLVLIDEPEAHLHPPLLSAFIRAVSDLLVNRNGVAIIATHSPVVLQEVPRTCVWKLSRSGRQTTIERPEIETFGENVGILTREAFGLEATDSGFHNLLRRAYDEQETFDSVVAKFGSQLGGEARAIVRAMGASNVDD